MKASQQKQFTPVTITLETQEEVDKLFAVLDHAKIQKALDWANIEEVLSPYKTVAYQVWHRKITPEFKNA